MKRSFVWLAYLVLLAPVLGCGKSVEQANLELEQDKLRLDLLRAGRDELASLMEKEKELRELERKNLLSARELDQCKVNLKRREQQIQQQQIDLKLAAAALDEKSKAAENELQVKEIKLKELEEQNKKTIKQLLEEKIGISNKWAALKAASAGSQAPGGPTNQLKQSSKSGDDTLANARAEFSTALADTTIRIVENVPIGPGHEDPQGAQQELLRQLKAITKIESEEQFQRAARLTAEQFAMKSTNGTLISKEKAVIRRFGKPGPAKQLPPLTVKEPDAFDLSVPDRTD